MYRLNENTPLTKELISAYIQDFRMATLPNLIKYKNYYEGKSKVLNRVMSDPSKPNNKVAHGYANYISNTMSAYFMGNGVSYSSEENIDELNDIFRYNDEKAENIMLAKDTSIFGVAHELTYIDPRGKIRFKRLSPLESIPIYDDTLEDELLYFIRFYDVKSITDSTDNKIAVEVYTRQSRIKYMGNNEVSELTLIEEAPHGFLGYVPISIYKNNEEEMNDFGLVIPLIDAYDSVVSDSVNDMDQFADSYMILKGLGAVEDDTLQSMKENRILLLDEDSEASFLTKDVNDSYANNIENRLNDDIYKFSGCVDLTSDISALSGVAIKYRLLSMENIASGKETYFRKGLLRRIELIALIVSAFNPDTIITDIDITFSRNLPTDDNEAVTMVNQLQGLISDETLLGLLPFIDDPAKELDKRAKDTDIFEVAAYGNTKEEEETTEAD